MATLKPCHVGPPRTTTWNTLNLQEIKASITAELSVKEIDDMNMRLLGKIIYWVTIILSRKVNEELLEPISQWLNDPDWMTRFEIREDGIPNWAAYKRRQRKWSAQQKRLAAERLKLYRQEILRKRKFRKELCQITGRLGSRDRSRVRLDQDFITPIISPFSPPELHKAETGRQFRQALSLSVSDLLPWKLFLISELGEAKKLTDLGVYYPENRKKDLASKLIHLLELEKENRLTISQEEPFGDITIRPSEDQTMATISVRDEQGRDYHFDWLNLTEKQKKRIIADIKAYRILSRGS